MFKSAKMDENVRERRNQTSTKISQDLAAQTKSKQIKPMKKSLK